MRCSIIQLLLLTTALAAPITTIPPYRSITDSQGNIVEREVDRQAFTTWEASSGYDSVDNFVVDETEHEGGRRIVARAGKTYEKGHKPTGTKAEKKTAARKTRIEAQRREREEREEGETRLAADNGEQPVRGPELDGNGRPIIDNI